MFKQIKIDSDTNRDGRVTWYDVNKIKFITDEC